MGGQQFDSMDQQLGQYIRLRWHQGGHCSRGAWLGWSLGLPLFHPPCPQVNKPFWKSFNQAAGVYAVGEVYNGNIQYVSGYQSQALDAVLSYPMFFVSLFPEHSAGPDFLLLA